MYRAAWICASDPERGLNPKRAATLALVHDLAEALIPDFTPASGMDRAKKFALENEAWDKLVDRFGRGFAELKSTWLEYAANESGEAKLASQLDKLDPVVQSLRYEKMGYPVSEDFIASARLKIADLMLMRVLELLLAHRTSVVSVYDQFFALLEFRGDRARFEVWLAQETQRWRDLQEEAHGL